MRRFRGLSALAALGALSAATYAGALPAAAWLGVGLLAAHPVVVAVLFVLYLAVAWLVSVRILPTKKALAVVLGFGLLFRVLMLPTPVYLACRGYANTGRVRTTAPPWVVCVRTTSSGATPCSTQCVMGLTKSNWTAVPGPYVPPQ